LEESLIRLKTDHIDLVQFHEILRFDDPDRIFTEGGALEALTAARKAGKIRYIGFTGHKDPRVHLYMLEVAKRHNFKFDSVQMPLNVMDASFRSFSHLVVPPLAEQNIGILEDPEAIGDGSGEADSNSPSPDAVPENERTGDEPNPSGQKPKTRS
jgi:aryl-alcohol dehydrogenase-like predicted oxidoreductase